MLPSARRYWPPAVRRRNPDSTSAPSAASHTTSFRVHRRLACSRVNVRPGLSTYSLRMTSNHHANWSGPAAIGHLASPFADWSFGSVDPFHFQNVRPCVQRSPDGHLLAGKLRRCLLITQRVDGLAVRERVLVS